MLYRVRAYRSRSAGESGWVPSNELQTGDFRTAQHAAKGWAQDYGAAVIVNTETGLRTWFGK